MKPYLKLEQILSITKPMPIDSLNVAVGPDSDDKQQREIVTQVQAKIEEMRQAGFATPSGAPGRILPMWDRMQNAKSEDAAHQYRDEALAYIERTARRRNIAHLSSAPAADSITFKQLGGPQRRTLTIRELGKVSALRIPKAFTSLNTIPATREDARKLITWLTAWLEGNPDREPEPELKRPQATTPDDDLPDL